MVVLFWDPTRHAWSDAADMKPSDLLDTPGDGHTTVLAVRVYADTIRTYNLTIDSVHTFYVLAGSTAVLVHNCSATPELNWNPKSRPTFGRSFDIFGAGVKNTRSLTDRARSTGQDQGQWLDKMKQQTSFGRRTRLTPVYVASGFRQGLGK
jgi:hypothetical protein